MLQGQQEEDFQRFLRRVDDISKRGRAGWRQGDPGRAPGEKLGRENGAGKGKKGKNLPCGEASQVAGAAL